MSALSDEVIAACAVSAEAVVSDFEQRPDMSWSRDATYRVVVDTVDRVLHVNDTGVEWDRTLLAEHVFGALRVVHMLRRLDRSELALEAFDGSTIRSRVAALLLRD